MIVGKPGSLSSQVPAPLEGYLASSEWSQILAEIDRIDRRSLCRTICCGVCCGFCWFICYKCIREIFLRNDLFQALIHFNSTYFRGLPILVATSDCTISVAEDRIPQLPEPAGKTSSARAHQQTAQQPQMMQPQPQMIQPQPQMIYCQAPQGQMMYAQAPQGQMMYGQMPQGQMMYGGQEQPMIVAQPQHAAPHAVAPAPTSMIGASSM